MNYEIIEGDCLETMRALPAGSVQMVCTSPPYFGLRDYGTATWEGGDAECDHQVGRFTTPASDKQHRNNGSGTLQAKDVCPMCGARRIDNQIGLEETPEAYVAKLVHVFREVRRVLREDGVLWLNLGDSYNGSGGSTTTTNFGKQYDGTSGSFTCQPRNVDGLKPKDLIGIPWMVAFALRADGWYLRSEIIWHKKAPMPESVTDRPTKAHEQVFLLSKSAKYFYDAEAIKEPASQSTNERDKYQRIGYAKENRDGFVNHLDPASGAYRDCKGQRNKRTVWTLGPEVFREAHFAVMPTKLVEPCILAGSSSYGCCAACGSPYERVTDDHKEVTGHGGRDHANNRDSSRGDVGVGTMYTTVRKTVGWQPTCNCDADVVPCTVLDPFSGASTVGVVALKHGRRYIGCELNPDYIALSHDRLGKVQPMLLEAI